MSGSTPSALLQTMLVTAAIACGTSCGANDGSPQTGLDGRVNIPPGESIPPDQQQPAPGSVSPQPESPIPSESEPGLPVVPEGGPIEAAPEPGVDLTPGEATPTLEPAPEPVVEPVPEPGPEPPVVEPTPEPVVEPVPEPAVDPGLGTARPPSIPPAPEPPAPPVELPPQGDPGVECGAELSPDLKWEPLDWSGLSQNDVPSGLRIFATEHPDCRDHQAACAAATGAEMIRVPVDVHLLDSKRWTQPEDLYPYLKLVNEYYRQVAIQFEFTFRPDNEYQGLDQNVDQLALVFGDAIASPRGAVPDGFGNLPLGKAVLNDQLMNRTPSHANNLFNPAKPIGHELGHVLGLAHNGVRSLLMAQGTSAANDFKFLPEQAIVLRTLALARYGGEFNPWPSCPEN